VNRACGIAHRIQDRRDHTGRRTGKRGYKTSQAPAERTGVSRGQRREREHAGSGGLEAFVRTEA
jgi:hypothetical protein